MKLGLVGYGKMGKMIEQVALQRGHTIASIVDPNVPGAHKDISAASLQDAEVVIDFTHPSTALDNIRKISALKKNLVVGTTGWYAQMSDVQQIVQQEGTGLLWSGNFSVGMNLFFRIVEHAATLIDPIPEYDIMAYELHHNQKKDSPSGTAEMLGRTILGAMNRKSKLVYEKLDRAPAADEVHVASVRGGSIPGTHTVVMDSPFDTIEMTHTARTREGFALGAVLAAEFINGKKGLYGIEDLMNVLIQ